ncbi:hypothetical protein [Nocardioides euryhalodurans]|uniref:SRPBCC family protein n=1 Tax=Nocardioides euryhalodurans TaxID=2518370 RepID=A0A4P7GIN2_9ACTN|nr:hypothetical protein [Nocardioides euryhalodurans]QBR91796.1 hypothetical protein EXE57_05550 [Nocardioides euryhalodurans]
MARTASIVGVTALLGYATLQVLGRRSGSTAAERRAPLPGDEVVGRPQMVMDHGATIDATAERIWPWLSQLGWHLGGFYTPSWVDRLLFPDNWPSLERLDPRLVRDLAAGDRIPDGRPGTAEYVVDRVDPPHVLVLRSTTHIPPGWDRSHGVRFLWTWCFSLTDLPGGRTRVHLRVRGRGEPRWFIALYVAGIVPADYVMSTGMLRGLRRRAEGSQVPVVSGREPLTQS